MNDRTEPQVLEELFDAAVDLPHDDQREYLDRHCPDPRLRQRVQELIASAEPVCDLHATTVVEPASLPELAGYEVLREMGRGGMAIVYKARQLNSNRIVALKLLRPEIAGSRDQRRRFFQEAASLKTIEHPNVVRVHDVSEQGGHVFLVLELVEGGSLAENLEGKPWEASAAAALVEVLARAIDHVHKKRIIHRDLKPSNVLLSDADHVPKVADFGLAKLLGSEHGLTIDHLTVSNQCQGTLSGAILGTPSYMAPEQATGQNELVGPATDVYALGAILFELLTGHPPFEADTPLMLLEQVRDVPAAFPATGVTSGIRDLQTICLKCLAKEPGTRYASAAELADDLRHYLERRPIVARRPGMTSRLRARFRRHPVAAALAASVLGLATMLVGMFGMLFTAAPREENGNAPGIPRGDPNELRVGIWRWPGYAPLMVLAKRPDLCEGLAVVPTEFQEGITVARRHLKPRDDLDRHLTADNIDASMCIVDAHIHTRGAGVPARVVLKLDVSHGADGIVTTTDVKELRDLAGKRIAYLHEEPPHFFLLDLFARENLALEDIIPKGNMVATVDPEEAAKLFEQGQVDAAVTWDPHLTSAAKTKLRSDARLWKTSADMPGQIVDILCIHEDYLRRRPENVQKLIRGWFKAVELLESGDKEALVIANEFMGGDYLELAKGMRYSYVQDNVAFFQEESGRNAFQGLMHRAQEIYRRNYLMGVPVDPKDSDASHIFQGMAAALLKVHGSERNDPPQLPTSGSADGPL
jgi:serine/threonine protein kinase/ABC-type nitrate/sulfonate/bicarbonate transport system substrate-binding protein